MTRLSHAAVALVALAAAVAVQAESFTDYARVRAVEPRYETVQVPRQECASQWVQDAPRAAVNPGGFGGMLVGGVAGGLIGNQVGKGHGREAATAVGAVIGAIAGDRIATRTSTHFAAPETREVRSCRTVYDSSERLVGYDVTYEYRGIESTAFMREQPRRRIPVRVSVTPAEML